MADYWGLGLGRFVGASSIIFLACGGSWNFVFVKCVIFWSWLSSQCGFCGVLVVRPGKN